MALDVGTLVGHLDLDDSKYNRKLEGASKGLSGFAGKMGKVVGAGALVAGAAVAGFAAKGVKDFASFQSGMNEVYTLLPGMSKEAMGKLSDDTRDFVKEMGVAHDEAVPALYSALSAGVPADNVFDFMEVAAKAAKGGVTDLNTAVDGITSVVNSYGDSLEGPAEASDLMFTAVRLGKTTFDELAASLFQVNPTAAALGVGFEDVTASLAVMTAQGVPTSVATTQLRQAMVELSKDGGKTSETFKEISGKTFKEFIAEGGNTGEALQMLADHAQDTGVGVNDLFGSVEAGNAALALTGENSAKFDSALAEMRDSAGATDAAFEQMDQGLERSWEKIQIGVKDAAIGLGEELSPAIAEAADWFEDHLPGAMEVAGSKLSDVIGFMRTEFPAAVETVKGNIRDVMDWFEKWKGVIGGVATAITIILMPALVRLGVAATVSAAKQVGAWIVAQAGAIKTGVVYVIQSAIIVGKWVLMGTQALIHAGRMAAAWFIALGPIGWVIGAIVGLAAIVIANWDKISAWTRDMWEKHVKPPLDRMGKFLTEDLPDFFKSAVIGAMKEWKKLQDKAKVPIRFVVDTVINKGLIGTFNKIPGVNLPEIKLPAGFYDGGVIPGRDPGRRDNVLTPMRSGEGVLIPEVVRGLGGASAIQALNDAGRRGIGAVRDAAARVVRHDGGGLPGAFMGNVNAIKRHGAYYLNVAAGMGPWNFPGAARMWDGAAGVKVKIGHGQHQGHARPLERGGGILGFATGTNIDMSPSWMRQLGAVQRRTVAAHEMGHAMGLPHRGGSSIMQPNLQNMASVPTANDIRDMQRIYPGGTGKAGDATPENPFAGLVSSLVAAIKKEFPEAGMFVDAATGLAKSGIESVVKFVADVGNNVKNFASDVAGNVVSGIRDFFGGGAATAGPMTLMDGGGFLRDTDGPTVIHKKKKPDAFTPFDEWQQILAHTAASGGGVLEGNLYLDSGEFLGRVRGEVRKEINDLSRPASSRRVGV